MKLYHGSQVIVGQPVWGKGSLHNDYGRGFYCTQDFELAKEWACLKGTDGYANEYELDTNGLNILHLNGPGYHILNWLAILTKHRTYWENSSISAQAKQYLQEHFLPDTSDADVICGYRADDSYFSFAKAFVANGITLEQLSQAMYLGELGEQVVLMSQKAFSALVPAGYHFVPAEHYAEAAANRDAMAKKNYRKLVQNGPDVNGMLMVDIMRKGLTNGNFL